MSSRKTGNASAPARRRGLVTRSRALWLAVLAATAAAITVPAVLLTSTGARATSPYPPAKASRIANQQAQLAKENASNRHKPSYQQGLKEAEAANGPRAKRVAGIDRTMREGPFSPAVFTVRDMYQGPVNGGWTLVYAGEETQSGTGALTVYSWPRVNGPVTAAGTFAAPGAAGPVEITAVRGALLTVQTARGSTLTFNLATDTWK